MAFVGALIVSTKGNRGHIGSSTPSQSAASASNDPGATGDRGRDVVTGSLSVESGETARRKREPGVLLAEAVSRRTTRKQDGHAASAGEDCE